MALPCLPPVPLSMVALIRVGPCTTSSVPPAPHPQASLHQMNQVRFYVADSRTMAPRVSLFIGGLPCGLSLLEYQNLLEEALATKGVGSTGPAVRGYVKVLQQGLGGLECGIRGLKGCRKDGRGCGRFGVGGDLQTLGSWPGVRESRLLLSR